ncbi:hypothetical protein DOJK_00514 [Patescibacteria group bacterium]|nr:hypothetical protein DOJK_00514 [Patescibacteria group bacterium]
MSMNVDVKVKNLGKIKDATFKVRPMTVITGYNGTGKSFFTKSLYSIFNVINKNVYRETIRNTIRQLQLQISSSGQIISYPSSNDYFIHQKIQSNLIKLQNEIDETFEWKIDEFLAFAKSKLIDINKIQECYNNYLNQLKDKPTKANSILRISSAINKTFSQLESQFSGLSNIYERLIKGYIENELKDNFQISSLNELISFGKIKTEILIEGLLNLDISEKGISLKLGTGFIDDIYDLDNVVFFESPAYWKVRDALKKAKNRPSSISFRQNPDDVLTGVPKYFYDLDIALNTKTKTSSCFESIANSLEETLGGEFVFKNDDVSFKDKQTGRDISKNLISFGMTNLGMIQALLKHNVITEGSFIFIDEPETNLHPEWQVVLIRALLELAHKGVNIVITTHSTDIIKALEVTIKKQHIDSMEDFISVHFVELDGTLLKFESDDVQKQLIEARTILNSTYETLYFSDL